MNPELTVAIAVGVLLVLLVLGLHVGVALGLVGFLGFIALGGVKGALGLLATQPYSTTAVYGLTVLPLFIFMGYLAGETGISEESYEVAYKWLGRIPGGLALATTGGATIFAAASGSSMAAAATFTKISLVRMVERGYDRGLAAAAIATAGTLSIMIPPSGLMVIYSVLTEAPLGKLLVAGFIPGITLAVSIMIVIFLLVRFRGYAPTVTIEERFTWKERVFSLRFMLPVGITVLAVMGGIYAGVFTPTEAGAMGAFVVLVVGLVRRRVKVRTLRSSLTETSQVTAMIFFIIVGAMIFARFLARSGVIADLGKYLLSMGISPITAVIAFCIVIFVAGMFLEANALAALLLPIFYPILASMGVDGVWFGVVFVLGVEISLITPPVGLTCFMVVAASNGSVTISQVFSRIWPFVAADIVVLALILAFPQIALWLPGKMG